MSYESKSSSSGSSKIASICFVMGTALATTISWSLHNSILWAIVHGALGWLYVIYYELTHLF